MSKFKNIDSFKKKRKKKRLGPYNNDFLALQLILIFLH